MRGWHSLRVHRQQKKWLALKRVSVLIAGRGYESDDSLREKLWRYRQTNPSTRRSINAAPTHVRGGINM